MITLNQQEIEKLNNLILDMPFRYAYPIFQLLKAKVDQVQRAEIAKADGSNDARQDKPVASENTY